MKVCLHSLAYSCSQAARLNRKVCSFVGTTRKQRKTTKGHAETTSYPSQGLMLLPSLCSTQCHLVVVRYGVLDVPQHGVRVFQSRQRHRCLTFVDSLIYGNHCSVH